MLLDSKGSGGNNDGLLTVIAKQELLFRKMSEVESDIIDLRKVGRGGASNMVSLNDNSNS